MERTQCQLSTRLTNGLCCNHTHSLALLYHAASGKVTAITLHAHSLLALAGKHGTNLYHLDRTLLYLLRLGLSNFFARSTDALACSGMYDIMYGYTTQDTLVEAADYLITILQSCTHQSAQSTAILFCDNHIMADIHQTTCQISGVGSLQSGIGKTLTSTVCGDKVFQHRHSLLKVRKNGVLDGKRFCTCLLGLGHQSTHTAQLADLSCATTGTAIQHHVHSIESLVGLLHGLHQHSRKLVVDVCPCVDNLVVTLLISNEAHTIF